MPEAPGTGAEAAGGTVLSLDNIALELPVAGVGSRVLAAFLDYLILFVLGVGWVVGGLMLFNALGMAEGWMIALLLLGFFFLHWGYFASLEIALGGRTPGKRALGLRVVGRAGGKAGPLALVLRNLVRDVDFLVGVPLIAADPRGRRLGDRLGGTLVVHGRPREVTVTLGRVPEGWGAREVAVAESLLRRADEMDGERARELARRLLRLLRRRDPESVGSHLEALRAGADPVLVLRRVLEAEEG